MKNAIGAALVLGWVIFLVVAWPRETSPTVYRDEYGCEFIVKMSPVGSGLVPRVDSRGRQICRPE